MGFWAIEPGRRRKPGHGGTLFGKLRQETHELEDCLNYIATPGFKNEKEKNKEWFVSFLHFHDDLSCCGFPHASCAGA